MLSKPTDEQIVGPKDGSSTFDEAKHFKDVVEVENECGGYVIVKYYGVYYVCIGSDYFGGYSKREFIVDYE